MYGPENQSNFLVPGPFCSPFFLSFSPPIRGLRQSDNGRVHHLRGGWADVHRKTRTEESLRKLLVQDSKTNFKLKER